MKKKCTIQCNYKHERKKKHDVRTGTKILKRRNRKTNKKSKRIFSHERKMRKIKRLYFRSN